MDSPPQTITVRGGDFLCEEKEIGFGRARLVLENGVQMMWIVSICVVYYNKEADKFGLTELFGARDDN